MLPVPKKWGQGWYPAQKISKRLPRARRKTNRNANRRFTFTMVTRNTVKNERCRLVLNSNLNFNEAIYQEKQSFACHMISWFKQYFNIHDFLSFFHCYLFSNIQIWIQNQSATLVLLRYFAWPLKTRTLLFAFRLVFRLARDRRLEMFWAGYQPWPHFFGTGSIVLKDHFACWWNSRKIFASICQDHGMNFMLLWRRMPAGSMEVGVC